MLATPGASKQKTCVCRNQEEPNRKANLAVDDDDPQAAEDASVWWDKIENQS